MQIIQFPKAMINDEIRHFFTLLKKAGCEARFVGGFVRDTILGTTSSDIDIAVNKRPERLIEILKQHNIRYIPTGLKHGTITVLINGMTIEITSLRKDTGCNGRHAVVEYTDSWQEDSLRRDFTINAMYADIDGKLYDFHNGYNDIMTQTICFVGNAAKRIEEDTLRILRFYRFVSSQGSVASINNDAVQACRIYAVQLTNLSGERIQTEMRKIINSKQAATILQLMRQHGISKRIGLGVEDGKGPLLQELLTLERERDGITLGFLVKLAALIRQDSLNARQTALTLATRWRLSNRDGVLLLQYAAPNRDVSALANRDEQKKLLRKLPHTVYLNLLYISWAENRINQEHHDARYEEMLKFAEQWHIPKFPITGLDLLEIGIPKGRIVGRILKMAEAWWESENYQPTKKQIMQFIAKEAKYNA